MSIIFKISANAHSSILCDLFFSASDFFVRGGLLIPQWCWRKMGQERMILYCSLVSPWDGPLSEGLQLCVGKNSRVRPVKGKQVYWERHTPQTECGHLRRPGQLGNMGWLVLSGRVISQANFWEKGGGLPGFGAPPTFGLFWSPGTVMAPVGTA